jgi:DNA-binding response OmpR family regulator
MRILFVEDDRELADGILRALRQADYAVDWVADGEIADGVLKTESFDLIILDLTLPRLDGFEIIKRLRNRGSHVPVLILTARCDIENRVLGLDLGADDYLPKPFALSELEARLRALLRRSQGVGTTQILLGPLAFDSIGHRVTLDGNPLELPRRELCLLEILLRRAGKVVSKEQIADQLFSFDEDAGLNAVEIYICRLRKKLEPAVSIRTVRGLGYLLDA